MYETKWGPFVQAREQLQPQRHNTSADETLAYSGEYLTAVGSSR